jgi:hypothetical protein
MRPRIHLDTPLIALTLLLAPLAAQEVPEGADAAPEEGPPGPIFEPELRLDLSEMVVFGGDLEGPTGEVDLLISGASIDVRLPVGRFTQIGAQVGYEHRLYDWHDGEGVFAGTDEPWEDVHTLSIGGSLLQPVSRTWAIFGRGGVRMSVAEGADLDDGATMNLMAGIGKRFDENLTLGVGVMVATRLEEDPLIIPAPQIDWQIDEHWRVHTRGPGAELELTLDEDWQVFGRAGWESRTFRLPDDSIRASGVVKDQRVPLTLGTRWQLHEHLELTFEGGLDVHRELELADSEGKNDRDLDAEPGGFLGISVELGF